MIYWSARQSEQRPYCLITPATNEEVSLVLTTLIRADAPFTFRSGGHTAFANGSNTDSGITVDLKYFDTIQLSDDRKSASIGAGLRWGNISEALDPQGLAVIGGRDVNVGVAGLLLGGGFSFFSGRHGWACDNVLGFELVLASGEIIYASADQHVELFMALRGGGGSSFGVVTRFVLATIEQSDLWARSIIYAGETTEALATAATMLITQGMDDDPDAHAYFVRQHKPESGDFANLAGLFHARPVLGNGSTPVTPQVFKSFDAIPCVLYNSTTVADLTTVSRSISIPYGQRQTWSNHAFAAGSVSILVELHALWDDAVLKIALEAKRLGFRYAPLAVYQTISRGQLRASQLRGGNMMGLRLDDGPMFLMHFFASWDNDALDEMILQANQALVQAAEAITRRRGAHRDFVYMNYAGEWQDVLQRYGPASFSHLLQTALRYDPHGDLQRLWRGYFKLY